MPCVVVSDYGFRAQLSTSAKILMKCILIHQVLLKYNDHMILRSSVKVTELKAN